MTSCLPLVVFTLLCYSTCVLASNCEQYVTRFFLDEAVDMITKARNNIPESCRSSNNLTQKAIDCSELLEMGYNKSGVYTIWPASRLIDGRSLAVYCDMNTDGGGWTLIQKRGNYGRAVDYFYQDWKSYKEGFGDVAEDFWLGNDNIFALSNQKLYSVRFDLEDVDENKRYAQYDTFWIDDESYKYKLHVGAYTGDAGDSITNEHNNQKFSTKDQENDHQSVQNCARLYKGGWWYGGCHDANPNGLYHRGKHSSFADGINWKDWKGYYESMESTEIKIRPKNFRIPRNF